ncbi:glycosyltransferase [bacterium]|nr:glycosyltransferase [bacterium]
MTSPEVRPFWLVIDIRAAASERHSGLARFVIGLSRALGEALTARRAQNDSLTENVRVLLISKMDPPKWAIELIQEHPSLVSFWSGGPGALGQAWDKPQYFWSSRVLHWVLKWSKGRFYWIAPGNFDRPVLSRLLLPRSLRDHIVQVIHDTIPLDQARSMGFLFRTQFSLLVKRTLTRLPFVFTVSQDSAERLGRLAPRRSQPIYILPNGVEPIFGALPRYRSVADLMSARRSFLDILFASMGESADSDERKPTQEELEAMTRRRWIIGVGRAQKYKGWVLAEEVVQRLHSDLSEGVSFIRVGGDEEGDATKNQVNARKTSSEGIATGHRGFRVQRLQNGLVVNVESLPDEMLAQLYRCADLLIHPSQAEGFGFPPVEAALSGLPVVYRTGTAVDGHFKGHSFHPHFWQGIDSDDPTQWSKALLSVLRDKSGLDKFMDEMSLAIHPRSFICQRGGGQDFRWERAAESLLSVLFANQDNKRLAEAAE